VSEALDKVRAWLLNRNPELVEIAPDWDLIENRVVDSLSFVEFVYLIEDLSGQPIEMSAIVVEDFRTLDSIGRRYLGVTTSR
jgi:acyl carrier protein